MALEDGIIWNMMLPDCSAGLATNFHAVDEVVYKSWDNKFHSSMKAVLSSKRFLGGGSCNSVPRAFQTCSFRFKSRDLVGHYFL